MKALCGHCLQRKPSVGIVYNESPLWALSTTKALCGHCLQRKPSVGVVYNESPLWALSIINQKQVEESTCTS